MNPKKDADDLTFQVYPDCFNVTQLEQLGFHIDSISLGFFLGRGYNLKQAQLLVQAFNGEDPDPSGSWENLPQRLEQLST